MQRAVQLQPSSNLRGFNQTVPFSKIDSSKIK